jgi:hypothetical protein
VSRSRWSAIGAAVAVSLGAGGVALLHADANSQPALFHALSPVRMFDTRDGTGGVPDTPVGPTGTLDVKIAGVNGVPAGATAVMLNVTVVNGTSPSFLTVWPTGMPRPLASSLNWSTSRPTPNGVTVPIGAGGMVSFYNLAGLVDVLADATGYYTPASTPPFTNVVAQTVGAKTLPATLSQIASVNLNLPDACPGADSWSVLVNADGYFLTGGSTEGFTSSATIALGLTPTELASGSVITQNFLSGSQWREPYTTSFLFTVDAGPHTFYQLGSTNHPAGVSPANNNLIARSVAVSC